MSNILNKVRTQERETITNTAYTIYFIFLYLTAIMSVYISVLSCQVNSNKAVDNFKKEHITKMPAKESQRAKEAVRKIIMEKKPVSIALKESGYKEAYYRNPQIFTRTKQFQNILDKAGLSDRNLAEIHGKLVRSKKEDISLRAVDLAYKVKGKYNNQASATFNAPVQIVIKPMIAPESPISPVEPTE